MHEIDILRRFRAQVRGMDAERLARVRAPLLEAIDEEVSRAGVAKGRPRRAFAPRRRWVLAASATAAAFCTGLALLFTLPGDRGASSASAALRAAAAVAADRPATPPSADQYVYTRSDGERLWSSAEWTVLLPETREVWIGPDGSGRIVTSVGDPVFPTDADRIAFQTFVELAGSSPLPGPGTVERRFRAGGSQPGPGPPLGYRRLAALPTDPGRLGELIESRRVEGGAPGRAATLDIVGHLLGETYAPPALRQALYRVAARIPGVELIGPVTDPAGRPGVAVACTRQGTLHELIFDPRTSALLAQREVIIDPRDTGVDVPAGTATFIAYIDSAVVDSTSDTAGGDATTEEDGGHG